MTRYKPSKIEVNGFIDNIYVMRKFKSVACAINFAKTIHKPEVVEYDSKGKMIKVWRDVDGK